jgi:hypothetical protein
MVDLTNFVVGPTGAKKKLQLKKIFWITVGNGEFTTITPKELCFNGNINFMGQHSDFKFSLTITDNSTCTLMLNGETLSAAYSVNSNNYLCITDPDRGMLQIGKRNNGTLIDADINKTDTTILIS